MAKTTEQKLQAIYDNEWHPGKTVFVGAVCLLIALILIWLASEWAAGASNSFNHTSDSWGSSSEGGH